MSLRISYFPDETDNRPRPLDVTWEQLIEQLAAPRSTVCTVFDCVGAKCPHKLGPAWSPAAYPPGLRRGKKNVSAVSVLVLDLDHMTEAQLLAVDARLAPFRRVTVASHSDRPGDRCVRTVIALDAPVAGADWPRFRVTALRELGIADDPDPSTKDASRIYFLPSRPASADFLFDPNDGHPLSTSAVLALAPPLEPTEALLLPGAVPVASSDVVQSAALELAAAWPAKGRHDAFLALAGGLALHGWPEDAITELTTLVARLMPGSDEKAIGHDRQAQASSSVAAVQRGEHVKGWGALDAVLTRPGTVKSVRDRLGMFDAAIAPTEGFMAAVAALAPPLTTLSEGYPTVALDALDVFAANKPAAVSGVTAAPGTFLAHYQQALIDVKTSLGTSNQTADETPMFAPARELFAKSFPDTPWLVRGLIATGGIYMVSAEPKSAKSWLALELAMSVASGTKAIGRFNCPAAIPSAYFFAEDLEQSIRNRLRSFAAGRGLDPAELTRNLFVQPRGRHLDLTRDEDIARVVASCRAAGHIGFLVLDPLRNIQSGSENESDDMSKLFSSLRVLGTILKCTILIVHHNKKPSKEEGRAGNDIRGSSAIYGALDGLISLKDLVVNDESTVFSTTVKAEVKGAKSAGTFPLVLTIKDDPSDNTAIHAEWSTDAKTSLAANGKADDVTINDLMLRCLSFVAKCEILKLKPQSNDDIRTGVKSNRDLVAAAMIEAERGGYILPYLKGKQRYGWQITALGRGLVQQANEPISRTVE